MRVLLSVVGTRGDVQPVIALALEVRDRGHEVHLCVPPNFIKWAQRLGFSSTPVGIEMRAPRKTAVSDTTTTKPMPDLITDQFDAISAAANGCDIIVGANTHQYAARSIAELHSIPYINAIYAPTALPTDDTIRIWNERSVERVNVNRTQLGLSPIDDVLSHIVTNQPLLATDPTLAPSPLVPRMSILQTGAWFLEDSTPLPSDVEVFLEAGDPPVYFGFGSMPIAGDTSLILIEAARAVGRRAIISQGWADLKLIDQAPDCIAIGDVNHQALFPRVAMVVHHGGAGTTHTAARAGVPQVLVPMFSDQPFWANRVRELGIGTLIPIADLTANRLISALHDASDPAIANRALAIAESIILNGVKVAARHLIDQVKNC
ncbi:glycosyltransferase family 1 protein [Calothrix sp. FACHB-156]|nr:glycosyltransferase family 1 protein [Calothrix sp. FACHB-156]